jgi:hypothetical protein
MIPSFEKAFTTKAPRHQEKRAKEKAQASSCSVAMGLSWSLCALVVTILAVLKGNVCVTRTFAFCTLPFALLLKSSAQFPTSVFPGTWHPTPGTLFFS